MRLIDVDNFKKNNPEYLQLDIDYVTEVTVEDVLDCEPTVKAIPIEWLKRYEAKNGQETRLQEALAEWEKENETN